MGTYNADTNPNIPQMATLCRAYGLIPLVRILSDQWSLDSANRVSSFHDGTNKFRLKIKFDPRQVPGP